MTTDSKKKKLLEEYAAAEAEERWAWSLWRDPGLNEAERADAYARWKKATDRTKALALHLTAHKSAPPPQG